MLTTMLVRFKYYHAWLFADAICNNSGLGFSGYDERGNARWDLASNVDVYKFEVQYVYKKIDFYLGNYFFLLSLRDIKGNRKTRTLISRSSK